MSDHQPITISVKNPSLRTIVNNELGSPRLNYIPKYAWNNPIFINNYANEATPRIQVLNQQQYCDETKIQLLNELLTECASNAFKTSFPEKKSPTFAKKWWTPELTNCKRILSSHYNAWRDDGFPKHPENVFFNRYQLARKNFRKAIKSAQNKQIFTKLSKINNLKNTNSQKFWTNMRQMKDTSLKRPYIINNKQSNEDITNEFADHFNTLLNNPRGAASPSRPLPETSAESFSVNTADVSDAILHLKLGKSSDSFGVLAEHVIHANSDSLHLFLTELYNSMFREQQTPSSLSVATLIPLVKSYKKSLKSPNNYHGISLIPILTKILEYVILKKCPALSESHLSQFGFKSHSSTLHAEFLINETVNHYNKMGSPIFMCSLDAEKAFDSCNWPKLFEKLYYEKNIPLPIVNVLKSMYSSGTYQVLYNGHRSYKFRASQGVFQGSILSPHLYNIYTEMLLEKIESTSTVGTTLHGVFTGIIAYADDIILVSPTLSGLQTLLDTCTDYFDNTAIVTLNIEKTEFIASGTTPDGYIEINNHHIYPHSKLKHLGFMWNVKNKRATLSDINVKDRVTKYWSVIHSLIKGGVRFCNPESIVELYKTLAIPTLVYGLELPHLTESQLDLLDREGRKGLKFLFNLSRYSKNHLNTLFTIPNISNIITNNKLKLLTRLMNHPSTQTVLLNMLQSSTNHHSLTNDCLTIAQQHNINIFDILLDNKTLKIPSTFGELSEDTRQILRSCCSFWNIPAKRMEFKSVMEERVPVRLE